MKDMPQVIDFLVNPKGRISRKSYFLNFFLIYLVSTLGVHFLHESAGHPVTAALKSLVGLFWLWPILAISIRRFHDIGRTGKWAVGAYGTMIVSSLYLAFQSYENLGGAASGLEQAQGQTQNLAAGELLQRFDMMLALGLMWMVLLIFAGLVFGFPGQKGDNQYGPDPLAEGS
jgi:uncharacterized membrane protein YhaH (DUF805 family)